LSPTCHKINYRPPTERISPLLRNISPTNLQIKFFGCEEFLLVVWGGEGEGGGRGERGMDFRQFPQTCDSLAKVFSQAEIGGKKSQY
jgi:hypothetical protein